MKTLPPKNSLHILPRDPRDFNLGAVFPQIKIEEVPNTDFVVAEPLAIFNQGDSDMCAAFAASAVSSAQEEVVLSPEYLFMKGKQITGDSETWGLDLRTICKVLTKFGSIKQEDSPYIL